MTDYICTQYLGMWSPGPFELVVILIIVVVLFGRRLPEIARGLGKSMTEFKKGIHEAEETRDEFVNDVKKIGDDISKETTKAAGLDEDKDKH